MAEIITSAVVPIWHTMTKQSIASIESQGFDQIIAVFDGVLPQPLSGTWDQIRLSSNCGQQRARNTGLLHATGKYVLHVDDDTTLYPGCLAAMVEAIERTGADFVYSSYDRTGETTKPHTAPKWDIRQLLKSNFADTTSLVRRHLLDFRPRPWDESIERLQDWDLWLSLAGQGCVGHAIEKPLFSKHYVAGDVSTRGKADHDRWFNIVRTPHTLPPRSFTQDWTGPFRANAHRHLWSLRGQPIRYVEVGIYEGRSGCWMLDNILTHPGSQYVGIDTWDERTSGREVVARANLDHPRHGRRIIKATSDVAAEMLKGDPIDVLYIDGGHTEDDVKRDFQSLYPLLNVGGIVAFDDAADDRYPGIRRFLRDEFPGSGSVEMLESNSQLWARKLA